MATHINDKAFIMIFKKIKMRCRKGLKNVNIITELRYSICIPTVADMRLHLSEKNNPLLKQYNGNWANC